MVVLSEYKENKIKKKHEFRKKLVEDVNQYDLKDILYDYDQNSAGDNIDYIFLKVHQSENLDSFLNAEKALSKETESILDTWKKEGFNPFSQK